MNPLPSHWRTAATRGLRACAIAVALAASAGLAPDVAAQQRQMQAERLPTDARAVVRWVRQSRDNEGEPFIVIDKRQARLWLFDARGALLGDTPVLLGLARGDASVPGIGEREMADIQRHERTTPAGRFIAEPGVNASGEDIFWIDYDAAVSIHRVRAVNAAERRLQRLASPSVADNRISYGCINVPAAFYDRRIRPLFLSGRGVVYVLPEQVPLRSLFSSVADSVADSVDERGGP